MATRSEKQKTQRGPKDLVPVYVPRRVHDKLKAMAAKEGVPMCEYLVDLLPGPGWRG